MGVQFRSCCVCLASQTFLFLSADHALYRADAKMEERKGFARLLQQSGQGAQREGVAQQPALAKPDSNNTPNESMAS